MSSAISRLALVLWQRCRNMYCPVYGCTSDSQKPTSPPTHFFSFPSGKSADQQYRRKAWIEFCKRKAFQPSSGTRICSLHFAEDAYEPGNSFAKIIKSKKSFSNCCVNTRRKWPSVLLPQNLKHPTRTSLVYS